MSEHDPADADISFVPQLDARQRAMLAEMGVKVWAPKPAAAAAPARPAETEVVAPPPPAPSAPVVRPVPVAAAPVARAPVPVAAPTRSPVPASNAAVASGPVDSGLSPRPAGIDTMDWPALQAAVAGCEACGLCRSRKNTVFGTGHEQALWMIVGEAPGEQ